MANIKLYCLATPNGQKISTFLEAAGIDYDAITIDIKQGDQFKDEFVKINPNAKIPAIVDLDGPDGKKHSVFESGAILLYLAKKYNQFLAKDATLESETLQWLFFQMGGIGPMFGQFGHFYRFGAEKCPHPYPLERYTNESIRLLNVLEKRMKNRKFIITDEISIADFAIVPWIICLDRIYQAKDYLNLDQFKNINIWTQRFLNYPGVEKGMNVCKIN